MLSTITVKRISGGALFKVLLVGFLSFHLVSTLAVVALVLVGLLPAESTSSSVPETMTVILILGGYLLAGVLFSPIWVGILWLSIWPGVWLYSLFRSMNLGYVPADERTDG